MQAAPKSPLYPTDSNQNRTLIVTNNHWSIWLLCAIALFLPQVLCGQAAGSFAGNVLDKSGSAIPGATVTVTVQATSQTRSAKTDGSGHYLVPLLPVGMFTVHVDANGFQSAETKDLRLQVDEARELDFALVPATVVTNVAVSADAVTIEAANPSLGQVITSQEVSQLPLNGRDFVQLATLTAGATAETTGNSFFNGAPASEVSARGSYSLSVGGSRPNATDWLLDGVDNNELTGGGIGIFSSIDDIEEFKVLTYSYSAEYGTRAGPTVLVTTKSGTNDFHGTLYEFVRNADLDAKGEFATSTPKFNLNQFGGSVGGPIIRGKTFFFVDGEQKYQREGIVFNGIVPTQEMLNGDFTNDAWGNNASGSAGLGFVPTILNPNMIGASTSILTFPNVYFQCTGAGVPIPANADGSQAQGVPCNKIPSNLIDHAGQGMMKLYPVVDPNVAGEHPVGSFGQGYNYLTEPVRALNETKFDIRLDHTFGDKDNAFVRFSYDQAFTFDPGGAPAPALAEANAFGSNETLINHGRNLGVSWSHIFTPNIINQVSLGYDRIFDYIASQGNFSCGSALLGIQNADLGCSSTGVKNSDVFSQGYVSALMTGGYWSVGDRGYSPFQGGTDIYNFKDVLELIRGKHDIRTGIDYRWNQMNTATEEFQDGFWVVGAFGDFSGQTCAPGLPGCTASVTSNAPCTTTSCATTPGSSEADLAMGMTGLSEHDQTYYGSTTGRRWGIYRPFVEDDWRVTPSLTLNLGLGWNMTTPTTEVHNRMADFIPSATGGKLLIAGQGGVSNSAGINMYWGGYEPRVGLTWKVLGGDKTVVRLGFGIYHDSSWNLGAQGLWQNPPDLGESDQLPTTFSSGCAFTTSYCAKTLDQTPELVNSLGQNYTATSGFIPLPNPQTVATYTGTYNYEPTSFQPGRVHQYNANVERELPGNVLLTAGYAGSTGGHLLVLGNDINVNSPSACGSVSGYKLGCLSTGAPYLYPDSPPNFNAILLIGDVGTTHYNSFQVKAETKTPKFGLYALVAYTYSRTYDNGLSDGLGSELSAPYFPLPNWQNLDWSLSQINLNNSFTGSVIYDLPFGKGKMFGGSWNGLTNSLLGNWQMTLIEKALSGFPVPLIDSFNQSNAFFNAGGNGNNYNRPDQVANCNPYAANHGQHQWIKAACFQPAAAGELGNAARVPVVGPDFVNSDVSLVKNFALPWHEAGLNFRAEFFNLGNHPQYGSPGADINAPGFGAVNSIVNNPRLIQLAMKLSF